MSDPRKKEFAAAECDHSHDICDDCLLIYFPFKLFEEALEEIKEKATISRKDYELMLHGYTQAKNNIVRLHFHIIRCVAQQRAWADAMEGSILFIIKLCLFRPLYGM